MAAVSARRVTASAQEPGRALLVLLEASPSLLAQLLDPSGCTDRKVFTPPLRGLGESCEAALVTDEEQGVTMMTGEKETGLQQQPVGPEGSW